MVSADFSQLTVRDADEAELPALAGKYLPESLLRDYLRLASDSALRCLVLIRNQEVIGFTLLVFRRPEFWPNAGDRRLLPAIVGLQIVESQRGQGYGSEFMRAIEIKAAKAGYKELYLTVAPKNNPRAYALYQRLGYKQLEPEPYYNVWEFTDSNGITHRGEDWLVDMMKPL